MPRIFRFGAVIGAVCLVRLKMILKIFFGLQHGVLLFYSYREIFKITYINKLYCNI